ncbi:MAG: hypothetical protein IKT98_00850 [Selenomonadaceae bacterium]|nr:hypothetical protein [Selenomonadaceae bacterium]
MENHDEVATTEEKPKKILVTNTFLNSLLLDSDELPSLEEQIVAACKEINLMRKGLLPEKTWDDLKAELEEDFDEDNNEEE